MLVIRYLCEPSGQQVSRVRYLILRNRLMPARNVHVVASRMRWAAQVFGLMVTIFGGTMLIGEAVSEIRSLGLPCFVAGILLLYAWMLSKDKE